MDHIGKPNSIECYDVSKQYSNKCALSHINLSIEQGEFVALIGPSGSGKTTLLDILRQRITPTSGTIYIPKAYKGIVILDEPSLDLCPEATKRIMQSLKELNETLGSTIIITTHDKAVFKYANRTIILYDGKIDKDKRRTQ